MTEVFNLRRISLDQNLDKYTDTGRPQDALLKVVILMDFQQ